MPYIAGMIELTVTAKGQITIKKSLLDGLGARVGDKLRVEVRPDGSLVIPPLRRTGQISDAFGMVKPPPGTPPLSIEEMNEIIAKGWAGEL